MMSSRSRRPSAVLAVALVASFALAAVDRADAFIYWANSRDGTIARAHNDGSNVNPTFVSGAYGPCGVAVDSTHIYWANQGGRTISRANLDGSGIERSFIGEANAPCGVSVDGTAVYWANRGSAGRSGTTIGRAPLDAPADAQQDFVTGASVPCGVLVVGDDLYWNNQLAGTIGTKSLAAPLPVNQSAISGATAPCGNPAADSTHLYWANEGGTTIGRAAFGDFAHPEQSFIAGAHFPCGVAVDATYAYWANAGTNTIGRAPLADPGSANQDFIKGASVPCGVAVDSLPKRSFRVAGVTRHVAQGHATVAVQVPGPGVLRLAGTRHTRPASTRVHGATTVFHRVRPRAGAKRRLRQRGRLRVPLRLVYRPEGGKPRVRAMRVTLKHRPGLAVTSPGPGQTPQMVVGITNRTGGALANWGFDVVKGTDVEFPNRIAEGDRETLVFYDTGTTAYLDLLRDAGPTPLLIRINARDSSPKVWMSKPPHSDLPLPRYTITRSSKGFEVELTSP